MKKKNDRTQNLFNALTRSGNVEEQFENIINECEKYHSKYKDPTFYPQISLNEDDKEILINHEWRRLENQYPISLFDNIKPEAIQQGTLGDCYFVVGLIYASHHKELVKSLFHPKSSLKYGVVLVYFWFLGERIPIIVDTQVAYTNKTSKSPSFSHPRTNEDSCWFVLVEKAYAKACGSYSNIQGGRSSFGIHLLFDYFSSIFTPISNIIPIRSLEEAEQKIDNKSNKIFEILSDLKDTKAMIGAGTPEKYSGGFNESTGLKESHAYIILDLKKSLNENKKFIKLRNPWGEAKYRGPYPIDSIEMTERLRDELNITDTDDGSFWLLFDNFLNYFDDVNYSLQKQSNWKEMNVYGKIDGYLDGRSPCKDSANVGCIPQWSIKFSKKTILRISFDIAGPASFHSIYVCENHGQKVNRLNILTKMMRSSSNAEVNGIEYRVENYKEPLTFFFTRTEARDEPCFYRILIQSPDDYFKLKKFDDDFMKENWNCFTEKCFFNDDENDQWDPSEHKRPLSTCKQWFIYFPDLRYDEESELRIRVFKNITESPFYLFFTRSEKRIEQNVGKCDVYEIYSKSKYEEFSIPINRKYLSTSSNSDSFHYVLSFYRKSRNDVNQFKFSVLSKSRFKFGLFPYPDLIRNCCYQVNGRINHSIENNEIEKMKQWCLIFKEWPIDIFIEYFNENTTSNHFILLGKVKNKGQKISSVNSNILNMNSTIVEGCVHDMKVFEIEDNSRFYSLCVTRQNANNTSNFTLKIYGTEEFDMYEINENGLGDKIDKYIYQSKEQPIIDFPEVEFVEQPTNFTPKKFNSKLKINTLMNLNSKTSISEYILKEIIKQLNLSNEQNNQLKNFKENHVFDLKYQLPNGKTKIIKNYNRMDFYKIFESFNVEGFYYSEMCIKNNFYLIPARDEINDEFYEELEMSEINTRIVTINYGEFHFIFCENETASEAYKILRKTFEDSEKVSIQDDQNQKLQYIHELKTNEHYTIHVEYQIKFQFMNGTFSTQYMDYLATVSDAKNKLARLLFKNEEEEINPDVIIIFDQFKRYIYDYDSMLKDIQDLNKIFYFGIDKTKQNKIAKNKQEQKQNDSQQVEEETNQNQLAQNNEQRKNQSNPEEVKSNEKHNEEETEPNPFIISDDDNEESKQENDQFKSGEEKNNQNQNEEKDSKKKNIFTSSSIVEEEEDKSFDSSEASLNKQLNQITKSPRSNTNHRHEQTKKNTKAKLNQNKVDSFTLQSNNDKPTQNAQPNQLVNIIFICDNFNEKFLNPIEKILPIDTTISQIQEMISYEFILPKNQFSIKYRDGNKKIKINPNQTIEDIKEKMKEKEISGKYRNYLYFDYGNSFESNTIKKYDHNRLILGQFNEDSANSPKRSNRIINQFDNDNKYYKFTYYNDDNTYAPKLLRSPLKNDRIKLRIKNKQEKLNGLYRPNLNQQNLTSFSPSSTELPTINSEKYFYRFTYEEKEIEISFPDDLVVTETENILKKMFKIDINEEIEFFVFNENYDVKMVEKAKTKMKLLKNYKIKIYLQKQLIEKVITFYYTINNDDNKIYKIELDRENSTVKTMKIEIAKLNNIKKLSRIIVFFKEKELSNETPLDLLDIEDDKLSVIIKDKEIFLITEDKIHISDDDLIIEEEEECD